MRQIVCAAVFTLLASAPVGAEEERGLSLMERGAQLFMEGIMKEMEPALDDLSALAEDMGPALRAFVEGMGPALADLVEQVEDWSVYEPPEILPNGDIIIRRKPDEKITETPEDQIDL